MGPVGFPEMFAIFIVALLLFGPKKLPELGRTLGKAINEFKKAKSELKSTFESHLQELERETRLPEISSSSTSSQSAPYSYPYEDYNPYNAESPSYAPPSEVAAPQEATHALPPAEPAETVRQDSAEHTPVSTSVSGTVARSNGARPLSESGHETIQHEAAPAHEEHTV